MVESSEPVFVNFSGVQETIPGLPKRLEIRAQVKESAQNDYSIKVGRETSKDTNMASKLQ